MGKVNLTKKNKSEKGAAFHRRKAALGQGKHKQQSHTKIDLVTAPLKVPIQSKIENVESEPPGPTLAQLQDILLLCHSENDTKVLRALSSLVTFIRKSPDLCDQNMSAILSITLDRLRHPDPKIQQAARALIERIFNRHALRCAPFISVFVRHVIAAVASPLLTVRLQGNFLLDQIALLPNLQPIPSLFEVFPSMIRSATTPSLFSVFAQSITKLLKRFVRKAETGVCSDWRQFEFPRLFGVNSATLWPRFQLRCLLGTEESAAVSLLLQELRESLKILEGESQGSAVADLCALLTVLSRLETTLVLDGFFGFVVDRFPYDSLSMEKNIVIAKFLLMDESSYEAIRGFLRNVCVSAESLVLFTTLGGFELTEIPAVADAIQELCGSAIADSEGPAIAEALLKHVKEDPKPTKRCLRVLISLRKGSDFQDHLFEVLAARLLSVPPGQVDLLLALVSSSAPLDRGFLRNWALFIASDEVEEALAKRAIEAATITNGTTDDSRLISFLMTIGARRPLLRHFLRDQLSRIQRLTIPEALPLFDRLDLDAWILI
jgi:hypothetical protein